MFAFNTINQTLACVLKLTLKLNLNLKLNHKLMIKLKQLKKKNINNKKKIKMKVGR